MNEAPERTLRDRIAIALCCDAEEFMSDPIVARKWNRAAQAVLDKVFHDARERLVSELDGWGPLYDRHGERISGNDLADGALAALGIGGKACDECAGSGKVLVAVYDGAGLTDTDCEPCPKCGGAS